MAKRKKTTAAVPTHMQITVPYALGWKLIEIAEERGSSVEEVLTFMLRDREANKVRTLGLKDKMVIGKYAGLTVESIVRNNPSYFDWMINTVQKIEFTVDVLDLLNELEG